MTDNSTSSNELLDAGKRLPYTMPDNFMEELENNVLSEVSKDAKARSKRRARIWFSVSGIAAAACVALAVVFGSQRGSVNYLNEMEEAYAQLSEADKDYIQAVYENDYFINY